ncbi:MAG: hypothetical protein AB8B59_17415 [Maribacter sp.]
MNPLKVFHLMLVPQKIILIVIVISFLSSKENNLLAQSTKSIEKSTSIMGQLFGPEALGIHLNQNLEKRFSLNIGLGIGLDAHLGFNVYLNNRELKRFAWYCGLQAYLIHEVVFISGTIFGESDSSGSNKRDSQAGMYIPIGFEFISKNGFTIQLDLGPNFVKKDWDQTNTAPIMGSLKIGYTFRSKN